MSKALIKVIFFPLTCAMALVCANVPQSLNCIKTRHKVIIIGYLSLTHQHQRTVCLSPFTNYYYYMLQILFSLATIMLAYMIVIQGVYCR